MWNVGPNRSASLKAAPSRESGLHGVEVRRGARGARSVPKLFDLICACTQRGSQSWVIVITSLSQAKADTLTTSLLFYDRLPRENRNDCTQLVEVGEEDVAVALDARPDTAQSAAEFVVDVNLRHPSKLPQPSASGRSTREGRH